jgi:hypothetical protein
MIHRYYRHLFITKHTVSRRRSFSQFQFTLTSSELSFIHSRSHNDAIKKKNMHEGSCECVSAFIDIIKLPMNDDDNDLHTML